tara:strand:+ start:784 stop:1077 length:294 start_codon:yes stop_codon:yes gene_type:complete
MAKASEATYNESELSKGQLRKLNALRKSIGPEIGERAFAEWLVSQPSGDTNKSDPVAERVAEHLWELVEKENLTFPRGGYVVRRGRGRVVVEPARAD